METAIENPGKRARVLLSIGKKAVSSLGRNTLNLLGKTAAVLGGSRLCLS